MSQKPAISVLMPVYNENPAFLKSAIKSILAQSFKDFELIILDDNSNNESVKKIIRDFTTKDPRVCFVRNKTNKGLAKTLNKGLAKARAQYIARLDSDDLARKDRLKVQYAFMKKNPNCVLCGSWAVLINEKGKKIGEKKFYSDYQSIKKNILKFNFFTHSSWFFKKSIIQRLGGYSSKAPLNEDYDLLLKLIPKHRVENLPWFLCSYRVNKKSLTQKQNKLAQQYSIQTRIRALKEYAYPKSQYLFVIRAILIYKFVPRFIKNIFSKTF
ncbi:MAG: glycosyltransferase [Patescibacteria group bacterium]